MANAISPVGADLSRAYTTQEFSLGQCAFDGNGGEFVFCSFTETVAAGDWAVITEAYAALALSNTSGAANLGQPVGTVQAAQVTGQYGWVRRKGPETDTNVAASAAANVQIASTTTAGRADDATGTGTVNINGAVLTEAEASNEADALLDYPTLNITAN